MKKNSLNTIVGLYGELITLKELIERKGSYIVRDWNGPDGNRHDFTFQNTSLEIKSTYKELDSISISNELQLMVDPPKHLYLKIYLFDVKESSSEDSVSEIIREIFNLCNNMEDKMVLINKLSEINITFQENYTLIQPYKIDSLETYNYEVKDSFPRIVKDELPKGITKVKYSVIIPNIPDGLKIKDDELWKLIK